MTTTATKRTFKQRLKHRTPEIIVGASAVAGVAGLFYIRKTFNFDMAGAFAAHAADPGIEVVAGNEEAFVVMTAEALATLEKFGSLDIADKDAVRYVLSLVTDK